MFKGQLAHVVLLSLLLYLLFSFGAKMNAFSGDVFGISTSTFVFCCVVSAFLQQSLVWFVWRTELYKQLISKTFGKAKGFNYFKRLFFTFAFCRMFFILLVGYSNRGSADIPLVAVAVLGLTLFALAFYTYYSVFRFFGVDSSLGWDHFEIQQMEFVKKGVFKYVANPMYAFIFAMFFIVGLLFASKAALLVAGFYYSYIWVHYFCTERPDFAVIAERLKSQANV